MSGDPIVITCEHGGNSIPATLKKLFKGKAGLLRSHRGWDPGALILAKKIASDLKCKFYHEDISRLVIEQNRSITSRQLFSEITTIIPDSQKKILLHEIYYPYHTSIEKEIRSLHKKKRRVFHFSIHSFTPVLNGVTRTADIGLLYDPSRRMEKCISEMLGNKIKSKLPHIRVRRNYPYKGTSDGLTRSLRNIFEAERYCGVEIEINQAHYFKRDNCWMDLLKELGGVIRSVTEECY